MQAEGIWIPPNWLHDFGQIFSRTIYHPGSSKKTLKLVMTETVTLTDVILGALSIEGYDLANDSSSVLEDWLSEESVILRQGQIHTLTSVITSNGTEGSPTVKSYQFRIIMTEPMLQGVARKGSTRLYVTLATSSSGEYGNLDIDEEMCSEDAVEIDETFLANSVLQTKYLSTLGAQEQDSGAPDHKSTNDQPDDSKMFQTQALQAPVSDDHGDCTLYLRTSDMGKVGVLNGDWVSFQDRHSNGKISFHG